MLGGILTVADDLLKNDGRKFIEMMEQLAERRMQKDEETQLVSSSLHHPSYHPGGDGNHPSHLGDEDDFEGDEEDEDFEDAQTDEYEDEDETVMFPFCRFATTEPSSNRRLFHSTR